MGRDTPTLPIVERYFYGEYYKCPCCKLIIMKYDREKMRYCCRCGQAIDWRGTYGHEEKQKGKAAPGVDMSKM